MELVTVLIMLPIIAAILVLVSRSLKQQYMITIALLLIAASSISLLAFVGYPFTYVLPHALEIFLIIADVSLLLFFAYQGRRFKDNKVIVLALSQLFLYLLAESMLGAEGGALVIVDRLSFMMFLIINSVGGIIIIYAIAYMDDEVMRASRKRLFLAYLLLFLSVMNTIVIANSLLLFFFLFEMTTLASYLLIAFREDVISRTNALQALWMNQIGGVMILLGVLVAITQFDTVYLNSLMEQSGSHLLFVIALLSMAAFVKAAAMPFDRWLIGAMVAPTPVSAMLHSATMVKVAPFMLLKFAPLLAGTLLGSAISVFGILVFVAASYAALSKVMFKEILGYSTIALLGLMMSMAAIGSEASMQIAMILMVFHALSKALLFLAAGVLEKVHHVKSIEAMKGLVQVAPKSVFFIIFGFMTLILPPFGLFMGKLFALQVIAENLMQAPWQIIVLLGIIIGGVLLALLYFKVVSALLSKASDLFMSEKERLGLGYSMPLLLLSLLIVLASIWLFKTQSGLPMSYLLIPLLLVALVPLAYRRLESYDRTTEYHCGEKEAFDSALFYFDMRASMKRAMAWSFALLFVGLALAGVLS